MKSASPHTQQWTEEDLIAYHLDELPRLRALSLRRALENDAALAAESEAIGRTLRAFRDASTPVVNEVILQRSWTRVRSSLPVLASGRAPMRRIGWFALGVGTSAAAVVAVVLLLLPSHLTVRPAQPSQAVVAHAVNNQQRLPVAKEGATKLLSELHSQRDAPRKVNNRPGPLTTAPTGQPEAVLKTASYLDSAERVLTEVSHNEGPLQPETRAQVHRLLLNNALYERQAQQHGDLAQASVMEDLGRVLTTLDAEPAQSEESDDAVRLQVNVGGVLFDLRVLHHNNRRGSE